MKRKVMLLCLWMSLFGILSGCKDDDGEKADAAVDVVQTPDVEQSDLLRPDLLLPDLAADQKPFIEAILPDNGFSEQSTAVVLIGKNFVHPVTVYLGGGNEDIISNTNVTSPISMSFTMPPNPYADKTKPAKISVSILSEGVFSNLIYFQYTVTIPMDETFKGSVLTPTVKSYFDFFSKPIEGKVFVEGGAPAELRAEVGLGKEGSDPSKEAGWRWYPATQARKDGSYDVYTGQVKPTRSGTEPTGTFDVAYRFSKDGGKRWIYADRDETDLAYDPAKAAKVTATEAPDHYCQVDDDCITYTFDKACEVDTKDSDKNHCVQCLNDEHCQKSPSALGPRCDQAQRKCYCSDDNDCTTSPNGLACLEKMCSCEGEQHCKPPSQCVQDEKTGLIRCMLVN